MNSETLKDRMLIYDITNRKILFARDRLGHWYRLVGKCNRCGGCCKGYNCEYISFKDGVAVCAQHVQGFGKPWVCWLYPKNPDAKLDDRCGYSWQRVGRVWEKL